MFSKRHVFSKITVFVLLLALLGGLCSCVQKPVQDGTPYDNQINNRPDHRPGEQAEFSPTRIDRHLYDDDRNIEIFLPTQEQLDRLNQIISRDKWTPATDVPAMGIEPEYMLYDKITGDYASINPWEDDQCLVVLRFNSRPEDIELYFAPETMREEFSQFMQTLSPLPGQVESNNDWISTLFNRDPFFGNLVFAAPLSGIGDDQLSVYAVWHLIYSGAYSAELGNTAAEYHAVTEKYTGKRIENFDNGMTEIIPETGNIRATGWDQDFPVCVVPESYTQNDDGMYSGIFYAYEVPAFYNDEMTQADIDYFENIQEYALTGNVRADHPFLLVQIDFELGYDQGEYLIYRNIELVNRGS